MTFHQSVTATKNVAVFYDVLFVLSKLHVTRTSLARRGIVYVTFRRLYQSTNYSAESVNISIGNCQHPASHVRGTHVPKARQIKYFNIWLIIKLLDFVPAFHCAQKMLVLPSPFHVSSMYVLYVSRFSLCCLFIASHFLILVLLVYAIPVPVPGSSKYSNLPT